MSAPSCGAWWGGIPCAIGAYAPTYTRARGLEPATASVAFPRSYFTKSLAPLPPSDPFRVVEGAPLPPIERMHEETPATFSPIERPPFAGDLVIAQGPPGEAGALQLFEARWLYLVEALIPDPQHGDDSLVQCVLSDIRRFWDDYGDITRSWNVGLGQSSVQRIGADGVTLDRPKDRIYVAHTAKERGTQAVPLREIVQDLLNALPGKLQIVEWPEDVAPPVQTIQRPDDETPERVFEVRCWGASPKEVLRGVLDAANLVIDVDESLAVRVSRLGQGKVGERRRSGSELVEHDPVTGEGAWAGQVTADGNRYSRRPSHRPTEVAVIGDRTVFEVAVDYLTPVLVYEDTDLEGKPRTTVLEVTPDNMQILARGGADPGEAEILLTEQGDRARLKVLLGAQDRKVLEASTGPDGAPPPPAEADDGHLWQRLPFQDGGAWSAHLPFLSDRIRKLLRSQLWRYYQIPDSLRRLLPILKRAALDYKGDRLEPRCEAFTYRAASVRLPVEKRDEGAANRRGKPNEIRLALVNELEATQKAINEMEARKERLRAPSAREVLDAVAITFKGGHARATGQGKDVQLYKDIKRAEGTFHNFLESWAQVGRGWMRAYIAEPAKYVGADSLGRFLGDMAKGTIFEGASDGLSSDDVANRLAQIDEELKDLRANERRLVAELNPRAAKQRELGAIDAQIKAAADSGGLVNRSLRRRAEALRAEIAAMEKAETEEKPRADDQPEFYEKVFHHNLVRDEVPFRIVDENLGIIEVLGESLPGWLAEPMVEDPEATWFIPMPVRLTFGTWNRLDPELRTGDDIRNMYATLSVAMLRAMFPQTVHLFTDLGDRMPSAFGEEQIRFTFTVEDQTTGGASVGPYPWRVLYDDPENPLRLLVQLPAKDPNDPRRLGLLPPEDNYDDLLRRARPFARAALAVPAELDGGSLTLVGPRNVSCNGRVSAVEVRLLDRSKGFATEVSFAADAAPLPGVDGPVRPAGPIRLVFGLDVEQGRND